MGTGGLDLLFLDQALEVARQDLREAPILRRAHDLAPSELKLATAARLCRIHHELRLRTDGHQDLADAHTSSCTHGLSVRLAHTLLQAIRTCTRKHLVDAEHVEGVHTDADVERVLTACFHHVLVARDTGGLEGLAADLLLLHGDNVYNRREGLNTSATRADIVDADLGVRDTTAETALRVRFVLLHAVAAGGAAAHYGFFLDTVLAGVGERSVKLCKVKTLVPAQTQQIQMISAFGSILELKVTFHPFSSLYITLSKYDPTFRTVAICEMTDIVSCVA